MDKAVPISDLGVHPGAARPAPLGEGRELLVRSRHFNTEAVRLKPGAAFTPSAEDCQLWICLEGGAEIGGAAVRPGEVWLLPEAGPQPEVRAEQASRFLRTYVPRPT